jgi:NIMA (never in mitosis gene a)-related kinase
MMEDVKGYYLGSQIGEGAYGKVFRGYFPKLDLNVCIKELGLSEYGQKWNAENELSIFKVVNHPNIIKYIDNYQFAQKQYIVMELIETGNLSSLIEQHVQEQKFIPEELILKYFSQLISVLKYCFDKRIIHRDIKPDNILYLKSNVVKLADFGISRVVQKNKKELGSTNGSSGGPESCPSPEVSQGDFYSFPTDVWSLGVVMYQLMTLELPFEGSNSMRTHHLIIDEDYPPSPITGNYSEELKQVIYKMLEKNQYERIHMNELYQNSLFTPINVQEDSFKFFMSGLKYFKGFGVAKDLKQASSLFKASAD